MNVTLHVIICAVVVVITVCMFLYRRWLENREDHYIHLHNDSHDSTIIATQEATAKRLESIDKVKNTLLVVSILYILAIIGMALYTAWNNQGA
jgi:NADH:ubiquinone oxidoreductase subunit 3 (subunit A)